MVQTPCVGICQIHDVYKICKGCYRSRLQIAKWNNTTDTEKLLIISQLHNLKVVYGDLCQK